MVNPNLSTQLLTRPAEINNCADDCPDCPETHDYPPTESECPYFDKSGEKAICIRPGGMLSQFRRQLGFTATNSIIEKHEF
jgi:hypothetical protein